MPERRAEEDNRSRLEAIHADYLRFSRRIGVTLAVMGGVLIVGLAAFGYVIDQQRHTANDIRVIAERADNKAETSRTLATLQRERICSESSDRDVACRALFDRLAAALSDKQRQALACAVLDELSGATARALRADSDCP